MELTYDEARAYIKEASKTGSVLGLKSIERLMKQLGNVQDELRIIHIAGTNGKGSVGAYLASVFMEAGLHVGRYCSPAVFDPLEVWQYDGENMTKEEYASVMSQVKNACDIVISAGYPAPTWFEIETAMAFVFFARKQPDVLLLEVGMGGKTDATNVIRKPLASVITTISLDHMQFLGESVSEIASVKAGIIKKGCPVFSAAQLHEVKQVLQVVADHESADITFVNDGACEVRKQEPDCLCFIYNSSQYGSFSLETKMAGSYQLYNASLAVETAMFLLNELTTMNIVDSKNVVEKGIQKTSWPGRFEVIGHEPLFLIDGAHNEDAAVRLSYTLQNCFTNKKLTYIIGVLADKEHEKMLAQMLPLSDYVVTVTPNNPRALDGESLAKEAKIWQENVEYCNDMKRAVSLAVSHAKETDAPVLAFGSLSYLSDLKAAYKALYGE